MALLTFKQRNPYVSTTPKVSQRRAVKPLGLLAMYRPAEQSTGLLGEPVEPQNKVRYDQQQLTRQPIDQTFALQQYYQKYLDAMEAEQQKKDEQAMQKSAAKYAKKELTGYDLGTGTAGNQAANSQGYGSLDHANYNEVANTIDDAGGAEAVNADAGQGGGSSNTSSYLGAATGALAGYGRGKKNYYTDPAMRDGKDGFGKYHRDYRAEVGGGTVGGLIGYYTEGLGNGFIGPVVDWLHPYAQDGTRWLINTGDQLGGAYGAMVADPIGTWASGKYSNADLAASGLTPMLTPFFGGKAPEIAQKASDPISNIGHKIADVFGW